jgi:hypothetical protein
MFLEPNEELLKNEKLKVWFPTMKNELQFENFATTSLPFDMNEYIQNISAPSSQIIDKPSDSSGTGKKMNKAGVSDFFDKPLDEVNEAASRTMSQINEDPNLMHKDQALDNPTPKHQKDQPLQQDDNTDPTVIENQSVRHENKSEVLLDSKDDQDGDHSALDDKPSFDHSKSVTVVAHDQAEDSIPPSNEGKAVGDDIVEAPTKSIESTSPNLKHLISAFQQVEEHWAVARATTDTNETDAQNMFLIEMPDYQSPDADLKIGTSGKALWMKGPKGDTHHLSSTHSAGATTDTKDNVPTSSELPDSQEKVNDTNDNVSTWSEEPLPKKKAQSKQKKKKGKTLSTKQSPKPRQRKGPLKKKVIKKKPVDRMMAQKLAAHQDKGKKKKDQADDEDSDDDK